MMGMGLLLIFLPRRVHKAEEPGIVFFAMIIQYNNFLLKRNIHIEIDSTIEINLSASEGKCKQ